jgi:hypothetical protein
LVDLYKGIASYKIGDGSTTLFWMDVRNDHLLQNKFSILFSFAKNKTISVAQFLLNNSIKQQFQLPLSIQAFQEYQSMQQIIQQIQITDQARDSWHYIWRNSTYMSSKFYHLSYKNLQPPKTFVWI